MTWKTALEHGDVLISDGATGTELIKRGLPPGQAAEQWNVDNPDAVAAVARSYVEAGSDIILTNTFGGNRIKLERAGLADRVGDLNRCGVHLARQAAMDRSVVFASIGPTGEFMAPLGSRDEEEFIDCFAEQIEACVAGGAEAIVVESMADVGEVRAALKAARKVCNLGVVTSLTFNHGPRGYATMMGVTPERAARELEDAGADVIGANCGTGIDDIIAIARAMRAATEKPLWMKPNAGLPELVAGKTVFRETPEQMAAKLPDLIAAGANIIGGCCGTTPEHVRALVAALHGEG